MKAMPTEIAEVLHIVPACHQDARGHFAETYSRSALEPFGVAADFVQDNLSFSRRQGTVRGLHFQAPPYAQAKLVRCSSGSILDVAVDIRYGSPTFGAHVTRVLSAQNMHQLFVPAGFAHGFSTLSPNTEVLYKVDANYAPQCERGIRFDDPDLAIDWQLGNDPAFLSDRDRDLPKFTALPPVFMFADMTEVSECLS
ncbi:dTDP-4-dehydrorhamnose 3,5-epimerase [uncultured Roseibium sp.]|uniref:dTDP-4-dehydrorhamnose 3,5-epimerase n=1 Tax=uncultured Roseibium sp. TaxID=1936171 RepID=UPI00261523F8|nr:dTDP-4-dehydrorhamnose 3,5-epimerase [uncultured Roseibium sp.]